MKRAALLLLVCLGASCGAPVAEDLGAASCTDPVVLGAAGEAMDKINKARTEGYVFAVRNLANAHVQKHGENGAVFYLTMNVLETNCSVLSRRHFKACTVRDISGTPVYGQCKVAIFISRVNRVVRLYKYNCVVRPAAAAKVSAICPDCPSHIDKDNEEVKKTISKTLEKFNKESGLAKYFSLLQVERATAGYGMGMMYFVQYSIQETTCANGAEIPADCPPLSCEFGHKGFCKGSHVHAVTPDGEERYNVECEIFEPEAAETEKKLHQTSDHSHTHTHGPGDHSHDHSHDHAHGPHSHTHSHDHSHSHLHDHEHHHHDHHHGPGQHHHGTATTTARSPEGVWRQTAALGGPVTLPAFPDVPAGPEVGVTLPAQPDPQIPGQSEPTIGPFPASVSDKCPLPAVVDEDDFEANLFVEDPEFTVGSQ